MAKEFYTERDIEDMVKQGKTSLQLNDNVVLTELAFEKAHRLGLQLITVNAKPPSAPERPYIAKPIAASSDPQPVKPTEDIRKRIKDAVAAKLGTQIEPALLDSIITRIVDTIERK